VRVLFVHQNFPGQYRHLAQHYASLPGHEVVAVGEKSNVLRQRVATAGVKLLGYEMPASRDGAFDAHVRRAIARGRIVAAGAARLRAGGFRPDVILAHIGWGEALFLKDVFPEAAVLLYCEYFYRARGGDLGFDPEFPVTAEKLLRLRLMNAPLLMALDASDRGVAPTRWQQTRFPPAHAGRIDVVHEGVRTDAVAPRDDARFTLAATGKTFSRGDEVVTYVARNLEPYRGFHVFMRALPEIQRRRPHAHVIIVGGDDVSYSPRLPRGQTWRARMLREMNGRIDLSRVHFTGRLPYADYLALLQVSSAHVYLTYPFVLSWSLLEAMSAGCAVVASRTAPVEEVIVHGQNGVLADFFSPQDIACQVDELMRDGDTARALGAAARRTVIERYDLERVCLPAQVALVDRILGRREAPRRPAATLAAAPAELSR